MKTMLYNTPSPIIHYVKRSDVTRRKQGYISSPAPYFIVLASSAKTKEVKVIEFHRRESKKYSHILLTNIFYDFVSKCVDNREYVTNLIISY